MINMFLHGCSDHRDQLFCFSLLMEEADCPVSIRYRLVSLYQNEIIKHLTHSKPSRLGTFGLI